MRVLLVEDEPSAAGMLAKGLCEQAYAVGVSTDGEDASFRARTADYDAIVLDVVLPGGDALGGSARPSTKRFDGADPDCSPLLMRRRPERGGLYDRATITSPSPSMSASCWPAS